MTTYFGIPIDEYNGYYKQKGQQKREHKRIIKLMETFKEKEQMEPFIKDQDENIYYHPVVFHFIMESVDVNYAMTTAKVMVQRHQETMNTSCEDSESVNIVEDREVIVEEETAPVIQQEETSRKPEQQTSELTLSSYGLGQRGESRVLDTIKEIKPMYETVHVSSTGHVGDIHVSDKVNMIKYLVEVKDKGIITKDDIIKFENDIKQLQQTNGLLYKHIFGIFVSLESDVIPSIGKYKITNKTVYITKDMFNKDTIAIIFSMFESLCLLIENSNNRIQYDIPVKVYELISRLRMEYNNLVNDEDVYKSMLTNCESNMLSITRLQQNNQLKKEFIKFLNNEFSNVLPIIEDGICNKEEERLREYIKTHKKRDILKKTLMNEFPSYVTEISSMKLTEFVSKYSK